MIMTLIIISTLLYSIMQSMIIYYYQDKFFQKKYSNIKTFLSTLIYITMFKFFSSTGNVLFEIITFFLIIFIIIRILYHGKISKVIFHSIFVTLLLLSSEFISFSYLGSKFGLLENSVEMISIQEVIIMFIISCFTISISFLSVYIISIFVEEENIELNDTKYYLLSIVPLLSLMYIYWIFNKQSTISLTTYIYILILNVTIFTVYNFEIKSNYKAQEYIVLKYENEEYRAMLESNQDLKHLKHDFKNVLYSIKYLIDNNQIDVLKNQMNTIISESYLNDEDELSGCIIIDAILKKKINEIKAVNIEYSLNIKVPENLDDSNLISISIIIGNLIDNAIEGCLRTIDVTKHIEISIIYDNSKLIIKVANNCVRLEEDFSSDLIKSSKKNGRYGIGIQSIKRRVNKLEGYYDFVYKDNVFEAIVVIPIIE